MSIQQQSAMPPARFKWIAEQNEDRSVKEGRPVFEDVAFIEIWTPGDPTSIICRPVRPHDKQDYSQQWAQFEDAKTQVMSGTPLNELTFLTEAQRREFLAMRVETAEQLLAMPDSVALKVPGIHGTRQRVKAYLDAAAGNAPMLQMQAELEKRDAELATMKAQIEALIAAKSEPAKRVEPPTKR